MSKHLESDITLSLAGALVAVIAPCLREEEVAEARAEFIDIIRTAIRQYTERLRREDKRMRRPELPNEE